MVRYLTLFLFVFFVGCEINGNQIITPDKYTFRDVSFNSVTKNLVNDFDNISPDHEIIDQLITYWFDNKIKTNGFDGSLDVVVTEIEFNKIKEKDFFKFKINLGIKFIEKKEDVNYSKVYKVKVIEHGEISGSFSIKDEENLAVNLMNQSLESLTNKIIQLTSSSKKME
tara:strand:+ start:773 stop:1279 length:507 start_codon:yes stop_codon:yes gene_type:complete